MKSSVKTILLVEDDPINQQLVTKWLQLEGYTVCHADTGEKAIGTVKAGVSRIDMILMDIDLGFGMDGTEAARIILKDHDIPVIFLSSHTEKDIIDKIEEITSYGFVVKSSGNSVLLASVRMAFKLFNANREMNRAHDRLSLASRAAKLGIWDWDITNNSMFWDDRMFELYGAQKQEELSVKIWTDSLHPEDLERESYELQLALSGQKEFDTEFRVLWPDGTVRYIKAYGQVYRDSSGRPVRMTGINFDITDKKTSENQLIHSYDLLRYFITHSGTEIAIFDKEMRYLYVSDQYFEDYNLQDRDIIGKSHYEVFPDIPEKWKQVHQLALKGITSRSDEDVFLRGDGSVDYTRWECRPWYEANNQIGGMIMTGDIITKMVKAEAELRKLSQAVQQSPVSIMITDIKGNIEYVNPEFTEITGYKAAEVKGQNPRFLKSGETADIEYARLWQTITSGSTWKGEFHNKKKNGELYWESASISPIRNEEGLITHFLAVKEDTTEKKKMQMDLQQSENKFRALFENSPIGIVIIVNKLILFANQAYASMHGYESPEILKGKEIKDLVSPVDTDLLNEILGKRIRALGVKESVNLTARRKDSSEFQVHVEAAFIQIEEGDAVIGFVSDMTENAEREEKIQASLHEKEVLLKEVHHRVKNNLQIISSLLSLQTDMVNCNNFADAFNDSRNRVKTMSMIHEKLYQSNNFSSISFGEYASDLISFLKFTYNANMQKITFDFDFDEINLGLDTAIPCGLIINELVSNAFKYAFNDTEQGILTCRLKREEKGIVITVKDNGPGIDEEKNLLSAETLGLIMVNSLVTQLKATLEMRSSGGAEFIIRIPVK